MDTSFSDYLLRRGKYSQPAIHKDIWVAVSSKLNEGICILGAFSADWLAAHACQDDYGDIIGLWKYNEVDQRWESGHDSSVQYYYQRLKVVHLVSEIGVE